jgi:rSAM/selenodomain-associated transferase 1
MGCVTAGRCAVAVMAKAPLPGKVKTRLVPPLTAPQATALNAAFLRDVTENIALAGRAVPLAGFVAYAPEGDAAAFDGMLAEGTGLVLADGSIAMPERIEGIGRSLLHATTSLLAQGFGAVCLVNSDSPTLPTAYLRDAVTALLRPGERMVLGVAEDGGYYLIGLKSPHAALFQDIAWSTDRVSAQTLERARRMGLDVVELPPWLDVDDADDLAWLMTTLGVPATRGAYAAPATRAWVERFGAAVLRR